MLKIIENITGKVKKYALNNNEVVDSLFNEGGTLDKIFKIQDKKTAVLYWTSPERGVYYYKKSGLWGKFSKKENNKLFYQYTLDKITII